MTTPNFQNNFFRYLEYLITLFYFCGRIIFSMMNNNFSAKCKQTLEFFFFSFRIFLFFFGLVVHSSLYNKKQINNIHPLQNLLKKKSYNHKKINIPIHLSSISINYIIIISIIFRSF